MYAANVIILAISPCPLELPFPPVVVPKVPIQELASTGYEVAHLISASIDVYHSLRRIPVPGFAIRGEHSLVPTLRHRPCCLIGCVYSGH